MPASRFTKPQPTVQIPQGLPGTLSALWNQFYKACYPPHLFLFADKAPEPRFELYPELFTPEDKMDRISYKQLNASAYCLGAYMLSKGLKRGDTVLVIAENRPVYAVFEVGIQLMGGVNLSLPDDTPPEAVEQFIQTHQPKFICLSGYGLYEQHRNVLEAYATRGEVLVRSLYHDELRFTDKLVTLDALEDQGKDYWREHQRQVFGQAQHINPQDPCTLMLPPGQGYKGQPVRMTHAQVPAHTAHAINHLKANQGTLTALVATAPTWTLLHRVGAIWAAMATRAAVIYSQELGQLPTAAPAGYTLLGVVTPEKLHIQETRQRAFLTAKGPAKLKRLTDALHLQSEREALETKKQKLPFLKRNKLGRLRKSIFRPMQKEQFGKTERLLTHPLDHLTPSVQLFYRTMGLPPVDFLG